MTDDTILIFGAVVIGLILVFVATLVIKKKFQKKNKEVYNVPSDIEEQFNEAEKRRAKNLDYEPQQILWDMAKEHLQGKMNEQGIKTSMFESEPYQTNPKITSNTKITPVFPKQSEVKELPPSNVTSGYYQTQTTSLLPKFLTPIQPTSERIEQPIIKKKSHKKIIKQEEPTEDINLTGKQEEKKEEKDDGETESTF